MISAWCKVAGSSPAGRHDISIAQRVSGATKSGDVQTPLPAGVGGHRESDRAFRIRKQAQ